MKDFASKFTYKYFKKFLNAFIQLYSYHIDRLNRIYTYFFNCFYFIAKTSNGSGK